MSNDGKDKKGGIGGFGISFGNLPTATTERRAPGEPARGPAGAPAEVGERAPFRIVVLGELTARPEYSTAAPPPSELLSVDRTTFDRLMTQLAPAFAIEIDDPFSPSDPQLRIDLRWTELRSMRPDAIVEQVPALRTLAEAKKVVQQLVDRRVSASEARDKLTRILPRASWAESLTREFGERAPAAAAPAAPKPTPASSGIDALFDQIDVGAPADEPMQQGSPVPMPLDTTPNRISDLVSALAKSARGNADRPAPVVGKAPERVERAFVRILEILRHPQVRRLERSWRGLKLLVDRCDHRAGVEIDVLSADADGVEAALMLVAERRGAESQRAPVDLLLVDHTIEPTQAELERLERWATIASTLRAPLVVNGGPSLLGFDNLTALVATKKRLTQLEDGRALATRALASHEPARWITIVLNGPLVRTPYTAQASRLRELPFEERADDIDACIFAGGAFVVATLCAASHVRLGWPTMHTGPRYGLLENLPVHEVKEQAGSYAIPLQVLATTEAQADAARAGLTLLACGANRDAAIVSRAPVLYRGPHLPAGDSSAESTLSDQLFVARVANAVEQLGAAIPEGADAKAASEVARLAFAELFSVAAAPRAPEVSVKVENNTLEVTVRPHGFADVGLEELTLGAPLAGG